MKDKNLLSINQNGQFYSIFAGAYAVYIRDVKI
jgi:hypothetical protein